MVCGDNRRVRLYGGLACLAGVVIIWVASSNVIQLILRADSFNNSYFLTYFNTGLFTLYLLYYPCWKRKLKSNQVQSQSSPRSVRARRGVTQHLLEHGDGDSDSAAEESEFDSMDEDSELPPPLEVFVGPDSVVTSSKQPVAFDVGQPRPGQRRLAAGKRKTSSAADNRATPVTLPPFTMRETIVFALQFAPLWFFANFTFNWSLSLTSVASNTIISSTAGLFTFLIGALARTTRFSWPTLVGILIAFGGVVLIQLSDSGRKSQATKFPMVPHNGTRADMATSAPGVAPGHHDTPSPFDSSVTGDIISLVSAASYGLYTNVLKWKIDHEERISNPIFLGFVGLWNLVLLWPGIWILHATGVQRLTVPSTDTAISLLLNGLIGTVLSDLLWLYSVLLASPLIASLGTSFTIPLAVLVDWLFKGANFGFEYVVGGILVLVGFVIATLAESGQLKSCFKFPK